MSRKYNRCDRKTIPCGNVSFISIAGTILCKPINRNQFSFEQYLGGLRNIVASVADIAQRQAGARDARAVGFSRFP